MEKSKLIKINANFSEHLKSKAMAAKDKTGIKKQTPLTAELLREYGFERMNQDNIFGYPTWNKNDNEYLFEADGKYYHNFIHVDNNEVETLERLKLIYLALNNEELTKTKL